MPDKIEIESSFYIDLITSSFATGAATDADTPPTAQVFEDNNDTPIQTLDAVKRTDKIGNYRFFIDVSSANGYEEGKSYNIVSSATMSTVVNKKVLCTFIIDSMTKLKVASELDYVTPPDTFTPDMTSNPAPDVVNDLTKHFGAGSGYEYTDIFQRWYDTEKNIWTSSNEEVITPEIRNTVAAYLVTYNTYIINKSNWDNDYAVAKAVQWRSRNAAELIDWVNTHDS
jgi:hypothetical protein